MQYSMLGNTGLLVSRLCFGAMTFRQENAEFAAVAKVRDKEADAMVGRALDAGINFFDTADVYSAGESEVMLGAALKSRRNDVVIGTKVGGRMGAPLTQSGLNRRHILLSVDQSLQRLGTDWIDVYIVHREDPFTPIEETLQALDDIVRAGKARYVGFSNWSAWKVSAALEMQKANGWARFTHGQMYYSLLGRDLEHEVVPMMHHYQIGLTVWSPLASGFLSGKYTRDNLKDPSNRMGAFDFLPMDKDQGFALVEKIRPIAQRHDASVAQVALAWLLAQPAVTSVLVGATKSSQLEDNLGAVNVQLTSAELQQLTELTAPPRLYPNWYKKRFADKPAQEALRRS
ncbi:MAG TPA: aldo/keto reductase [Steroidobacteraceae bacterium]|nr:aldo/keto reductase [Steroidobacteraceae bacterium]